jgi:hypothetical protein
MLNRKYDPTQPYRYLRYGRMSSEKQNPRSPDQQFVTPRRRGRLRLSNVSADASAAAADVDTSLDPERFAGLADSFFWSEDVTVERALSWAEANASAVARARAEGQTHEQLADQFGVTVPTIRKMLRRIDRDETETVIRCVSGRVQGYVPVETRNKLSSKFRRRRASFGTKSRWFKSSQPIHL